MVVGLGSIDDVVVDGLDGDRAKGEMEVGRAKCAREGEGESGLT